MASSGAKNRGLLILHGNSHPQFAKLVASHLEMKIGNCLVTYSTSRESIVEIRETVRGRDVYIIQTGTKNVNNDIMETMILCYACKTADASRITVVMPYLPYCKQSKMRKRGSIVCQLMARMLCQAGTNQIITMDLRCKEIQGFFPVPVENLRASPFLIHYIEENIPQYNNAVIVARNPNAVTRATSFADRLRVSLAVIHGKDKEESETNDGRTSPPPAEVQRSTAPSTIELLPVLSAKEKPPMTLVGDVQGRVALIIDDIIDDVEHYVDVADFLHERGAIKIYVVATHGLLSLNAPELLMNSRIDAIIVSNSVPHDEQKIKCNKIQTVDVSLVVAEAIRRIHNNESMSYLFRNVPNDD